MNQKDLCLACIQTNLHWEEKEKNLSSLAGKIKSVAGADIILLPEMFSTGFSMRSKELAEEMDGATVHWMKKMAEESGSVVCGSFICTEKGKYFNRLVWTLPDGHYETYDKKHLFRMGNEHEFYNSGTKRIIIDYKGWRINPMVCYDLRFPVWCRQPFEEKPFDLQIFVANWPEKRAFPWNSLLTARAIENQCYVAGVNRVGNDGNNVNHSGNTIVLDPKGEILSASQSNVEGILKVALDHKVLDEFRNQFPAGKDADNYLIR